MPSFQDSIITILTILISYTLVDMTITTLFKGKNDNNATILLFLIIGVAMSIGAFFAGNILQNGGLRAGISIAGVLITLNTLCYSWYKIDDGIKIIGLAISLIATVIGGNYLTNRAS